MRSPVAAAVAIGVGLVVLLGFFVPTGMEASDPALAGLLTLRTLLIDWSVTLAGFASLVAIIALAGTHWRKLRARRNPDRYSIFMLAGFVITLVFGIYAYTFSGQISDFQQVVIGLQVPVEASLMAVLTVTLTLAAMRLFQRRSGLLPLVFAVSVLVFLLFNSSILAGAEDVETVGFVGVLLYVLQTLPVAGGRGILLGIALGSIMAGLRILFGAERPYSG